MVELSIIIPVKNEAGNIPALAKKIRIAMKGMHHEVIWVNDGSTDNSSEKIIENAYDSTVLIELGQNFGQSAAMQAGINKAMGKYISFLDGDGQNDPTDIPLMLELLKKGNWDMVAGARKKRHDSLLKKIPSAIANKLIRLFTGVHTRDLGCTLKIIKREIATRLPLNKGMHRFIPVLAKRLGASIIEIPVKHHARLTGRSKYGLERTVTVLRDLVILSTRKTIKKHSSYTIRSIRYLKNEHIEGTILQGSVPL